MTERPKSRTSCTPNIAYNMHPCIHGSDLATIFYFGFQLEEIGHQRGITPSILTSYSVKYLHQNSRKTRPYLKTILILFDSYRPEERDADLQFLIKYYYKEKFTK